MRVIGGEIECKFNESIYYTDSGRSSLRVFLRNFKNKKVLLPDFLCEVVVNTLENENIKYEFYHINEDLSIDENTIKNKNFDVLYIINYFGILQNVSLDLDTKIVIEDNVFFDKFENRGFKNWFGFNSYRKISELADGSLIKTNLDIILNKNNSNKFSNFKYQAKDKKFDFIYKKEGNEEEYLNIFNKGEKYLDESKSIGNISDKSIYLLSLFDYKKSQTIRKKRYDILYKAFGKFCINKNPKKYSFFVIKIKDRDIFRKKLFKKQIFLPIHWPKPNIDNVLYDEIISIPLFENYNDEDFEYLVNSIKEIL